MDPKSAALEDTAAWPLDSGAFLPGVVGELRVGVGMAVLFSPMVWLFVLKRSQVLPGIKPGSKKQCAPAKQ